MLQNSALANSLLLLVSKVINADSSENPVFLLHVLSEAAETILLALLLHAKFSESFLFFLWISKTRANLRTVALNELKEATLNLILLARGTARLSIPHRPARGNQCIKLSVNNFF